ncbi:hypothetical protein CL629_03690 [bacterium]|nr:hypothetical protein [bacterium]|tara:strand:- start:1234 stop:1500 length:267 start_codon:yes stop_codon:yes gene_type:complete
MLFEELARHIGDDSELLQRMHELVHMDDAQLMTPEGRKSWQRFGEALDLDKRMWDSLRRWKDQDQDTRRNWWGRSSFQEQYIRVMFLA